MSDLKKVRLNNTEMSIPIGLTYAVVNTLPATGQAGVFYFVPNGDKKDIYVWLNNRFEKL